MLVLSIRNHLTHWNARRLLPQLANPRWNSKHIDGMHRVKLLLHSSALPKTRSYINGDPRRHQRYLLPAWIKPALYVAGSTVLVVFAWPVLRFAIIGGLAYSAYKLTRLWFTWRQALSWGEGTIAVDDIKRIAQASLQTACFKGDPVLAEMLPDNVDDDYGRSIALADAMDVKVVGSPFRDAARVKALFPVLIEGRESALVVMASGSVGDNVSIDTVSVYTHLESGQIVETKVDVSSDSDKAPNRAERKPKRNVKDAEYKDL